VSEISEALSYENLDNSDSSIINYEYNGIMHRASWSKLSNGMRIYLSVPESEINALWRRMVILFMLAALAMLLVFIGITTIMVNRVTKPLTELTDAVIRMDAGDRNVDFDIRTDDEIGMLAGAFRQLTDHLSAYINDLNDMAYKDALTSVKNKGALDMYLQKLQDRLSVAEPDNRPEFAICMFDCNWLKEINDTYGHDKGDIYLKKACGLICDIFRHSPVFRLGGDEFVCVLQNDDYQNRRELCMEFDRKTVEISEKHEEPWEKVNIASGIAVFDPERGDVTVNDVYKRADMRMYEDKVRKKQGIIRDLTDELVSY
jgi:diguanylate cyclase (GGDEF)-like protein